ncbi:carbohydrate-binding module family 5 protein [Cylindrobasidium torrendii FP15055 ss-10]|uniref:chitinase n=1 Tax=Cylindrobasidium torrendii FP15055 ss-10 TaxID=1314674 RepID=A0A0D7BSX8_9AGAR|nr:carbohydrate-binding module family 5 protein [Cylindrobasidium torrendii FP15055 ss-10]
MLLSFLLPGLASLAASVLAYDHSSRTNIVMYYGQNSYGATHGSDQANWQKTLSTYCNDDTIDVIPLAFVAVFNSTGGLPELNMANTCSAESGVFDGTMLANCQFLESEIQTCQDKGKMLLISLGGATGGAVFASDAQAEEFATTIWNIFLGGSSSTRPFGKAVLDGVDLDIEGGTKVGFTAFARKFRSLTDNQSKKYYLTAAPQCFFPDYYLNDAISAVAFDSLYIQFYNNDCGVNHYDNKNAWNFGTWDDWAKNTSPNKDIKLYIGAPASSTAANSGYVDAATLSKIAKETKDQYSNFAGVMFWDASQAFANGRIDSVVKAAIGGSTGGGSPTTTVTTTSQVPTTTTGGGSACSGVAAWSSTAVYTGGLQVTYNGHLWTAKWWTQGETPGTGGDAPVWADNGACSAVVAASLPTFTDSVHIVDKAKTTNVVVPGTAIPDAEATASNVSSRKRAMHRHRRTHI